MEHSKHCTNVVYLLPLEDTSVKRNFHYLGRLQHNIRMHARFLPTHQVLHRLSDIDIFEEHVQVLMSKMGHGQEVDFVDLMFRYTLDAATHFLLGQSVDSLQNPQTAFADAFGNVQRIQSMVARMGYVRFIVIQSKN